MKRSAIILSAMVLALAACETSTKLTPSQARQAARDRDASDNATDSVRRMQDEFNAAFPDG